MKTSWAIGVIVLYLLVASIAVMIEQTTTMNSSVWNTIGSLMRPAINTTTTETAGFLSLIGNLGDYLRIFIGALFLYFPSVWDGYLIYFWLFVCVPVSCGMIIAVISLFRGSSAT